MTADRKAASRRPVLSGATLASPIAPDCRRIALPAALAVAVAVIVCSIYANLSFAVADPADYRYFPPFEPGCCSTPSPYLNTSSPPSQPV